MAMSEDNLKLIREKAKDAGDHGGKDGSIE